MPKQSFTTPVGRLVMGNPYKGSTRDADGNPLVFKSGANVGQPRVNYFLAIAIPKGPEDNWTQTEWGATIFAAGMLSFQAAHKLPAFAWKVVNGDDTTPNVKGKRACDTEGFPGNWIVKFQSAFAPKIFRQDNGAYVQVTEEGFIKPGYYVQINGTVDGNNSQQRPGLLLNHNMIAFSGYGQEIHFGADANSVGFGQSPLPAGATSVPAASGFPVPPPVPAAISAVPTYQTQVVPKPSFLMTPKAAGASHEAFKAAGWDDSKLIADGYMVQG